MSTPDPAGAGDRTDDAGGTDAAATAVREAEPADAADSTPGTGGETGERAAESGAAAHSADTAEDGGSGDSTGDAEDRGADGAAGGEASGDRRTSALDFVPSPVFVLLLGITAAAGWFSWHRSELDWELTDGSQVFAPFTFILGAWLISVAVHEFGRSFTAYLVGDRGLRGTGYLRFNPFGFSERAVGERGERGGGIVSGTAMPVLFVLIGGLGLLGPGSHIDRSQLSRGGRMLVPFGGFVAGAVWTAALATSVVLLLPAGSVTDNWLIGGLMFLCFANLIATAAGLLPIPGMNGYAFGVPLVEAATASPNRFERAERVGRNYGLFGVIAVFAVLWVPQVNVAFLNAATAFFQAVGLPQMDILYGDLLMRFWLS
ncbi:zinc metalloprotease [Nocardiopsis coralliicola]